MDSAQTLVTIIGAGGGGAALVALINGLVKWLSGSAGRERIRNTSLRDQRNEAWADADKERARADREQARADREARNRRLTEEYASQLRRDCTEHGMTVKELRPWPVLEKPPTEND
ncbi:hypothetical protein [Pseudarthrobacter sp. NIBRBAC000502770]|uniref:hypothetical protein n=1 Tax=Pseudarthrobacter sp. NIBRBAC000502770 TaxID=2590785 RepID=UPI001140600E|nr:hypothetical protein [Pseudarthrobacter sp. NIBRBAC000502770]QDG88875.1 hypothetical protein NIBR502770_10595 [Pseudarthrobacter sp. NIBRBAC000502770]